MKVLIFMKESDLKPAGGPAGFCYNIFQEVKRKNIGDIVFLPSDDNKKIKQVNFYRKIVKHFPRWLNAVQIAYRRKRDYQKMIDSPEVYNIDFSDYDAIHFHSTIALFKYRRNLECYEGKIILTTHSPVPQHLEVYEELPTKLEKKIYKKFYSTLEQIDEYAFKKADYVVFPCEDAEESYLKNWDQYRSIHDDLQQKGKLVYIPTGIVPKKIVRSRAEIYKEYSLKNKEFIISYVGRHNKVKGYDLLQQMASQLWKIRRDFHFIICGKESPIKGLNDERWTEIGWTNDSQSVIAASDLFVLPNRETYFDIIMLEVLSCGKIVVASRTGGNKYFEKIGVKGVFLYDTIEEAIKTIDKISNMTVEEREELEQSNRKVFDRCFTVDKYIDTYMKFLYSIKDR